MKTYRARLKTIASSSRLVTRSAAAAARPGGVRPRAAGARRRHERAQQAAGRERQGRDHERRPGQVDDGEGLLQPAAGADDVGAEQAEEAAGGHRDVRPQRRQRDQAPVPGLVENPPSATIRRFAATAAGTATIGGAAERELVPLRAERPPAAQHRAGHPGQAQRREREHADHLDQRVADDRRPSSTKASDRQPPAAAGPSRAGAGAPAPAPPVPTWSGLLNRTPGRPPGSGASMTPAGDQRADGAPAPPTRPRATKAASSTRSV